MKTGNCTSKRSMALGWILIFFALAAPLVAQSASSQFVPFKDFLSSTQTATAAEFLSRAETRATGGDIEAMRFYIIALYQGVSVEHSYLENDDYFDCVPVTQQPSVRLLGITQLETPPAELPGGMKVAFGNNTPAAASFDAFGNSRECEAGTIPMRRLTLDELTQYRNLRAFLMRRHMGPDGQRTGAEGTPPEGETRRWASKDQTVNNLGGISEISLWDPPVADGQYFSLAQQWYSGGSGNGLQTVEGGWTKYPTGLKQKPKSVLFIFFTPDAYQSGCYNLDCAGFVQEDNSWELGGEFPAYSVVNGVQHWFTMEWYLVPNSQGKRNWWLLLKRDDQAAMRWIGYYPESVFTVNGVKGQMTQNAERIVYGGETTSSTNSLPPMGSGQWPNTGWRRAAFHSNIKYTDTNRVIRNANLNVNQQSQNCYLVATPAVPQAAGWGTYFFFGGPGGNNCN